MDQILVEKPGAKSAELSSSLDETLAPKVRKKHHGTIGSPHRDAFAESGKIV